MFEFDALKTAISAKSTPKVPDPLPHPLGFTPIKSRILAFTRSYTCLHCALKTAQAAVDAYEAECEDGGTPRVIEQSLRKFTTQDPTPEYTDYLGKEKALQIDLHRRNLTNKATAQQAKFSANFADFVESLELLLVSLRSPLSRIGVPRHSTPFAT
jgi:hypothetical protein